MSQMYEILRRSHKHVLKSLRFHSGLPSPPRVAFQNPKTIREKLVRLTVCSYHVTHAFQNESTLYSCVNVKELLAQNRREIWSLSDCNWTRTLNHLARKRTLDHLAKLERSKLKEFIYEDADIILNVIYVKYLKVEILLTSIILKNRLVTWSATWRESLITSRNRKNSSTCFWVVATKTFEVLGLPQ